MSVIMFCADHINFARYLPVYYVVQLANLISQHSTARDLLQTHGFSVCRSSVPGCRNAVDLTIEQTINRSAKRSGCIVGFSRNVNAYYRRCLTRHTRASYLEATLDDLQIMRHDEDVRKTTRRSEIVKSEVAV
jgi:hypothetical protein